jgi:hypothetical protein
LLLVGKDLKDWDFVGDGRQEGVLLDGDAKPTPDSPVGAGGSGLARNDTGLDRFFARRSTQNSLASAGGKFTKI